MQTLWQDLRYGLRFLAKQPGFTSVAVLTLAAGIGLNTAIFSVVNSIMLRPLPYQEPERLAQIWERNLRGSAENGVVSPDNFLDWQKQARSFEQMSAYNIWLPALSGTGEAAQLSGAVVTANFFSLLGVEPLLGRTFAPDEEQAGKDRVVVISHGLWQNRLGGDPAIIGRKLTLNEIEYQVIGVLRPDYRHPEPFFDQKAEIWRPLDLKAQTGSRGSHYLRALGRLKPGVSFEQAQAEMTGIAHQLAQAYPVTNTDQGVKTLPLHEQMTGSVSLALLVLQTAVGFVLLIACVNVANLLLARIAAREKELAIRAALGASRWQVVRLLLAESFLLASLGGAIGLLVAWWGVDALVSLAPKDIPRLEDIGLDRRALTFTVLLSLLTVLIFGLLPAWQAAQTKLNAVIKEGGRSSTRGQGLRGALVVAEIALAVVLLAGSGLLLRSFIHLQGVRVGFDPENLLTMQVGMPRSKARESQQIVSFYEQVLARLEAVPGVRAAAITSSLPLGGLNNTGSDFRIKGAPEPTPGALPGASIRSISQGYFRALGVPMVKGRAFDEQDRSNAASVVIINEALARRYFRGLDPLGQQIIVQDKTREIIGISGDFKHEGLQIETSPEIYFPHAQNPWSFVALIVRADKDPEAMQTRVQQAIWEQERNAPISRAALMKDVVAAVVSRPRFNVLLLSIFSAAALILAAVGIYGVMSYTVAQSTREIGIRMALGAEPRDVLRLVVGQGATLALIGVGLGVAGAYGLTRLITNLLYDVTATDPLTFVSVSALLIVVALAACYLPARRATKVDPMVALRYE